MTFDIENEVRNVKYGIIIDYLIKYALLGIIFAKLCSDAITKNSISSWSFVYLFAYLIYLLYRENVLSPWGKVK